MDRIKDITPSYTEQDYLNLIAGANGFLTGIVDRLDLVESKTSCWPTYMYENVSPFKLLPPDPVAQAIVDLSTAIGNINLRLDALIIALDTTQSK